MLALFFSSI